ncbi:Zinc finger C2H2 superfamily [Sergentomyia squamirostris]
MEVQNLENSSDNHCQFVNKVHQQVRKLYNEAVQHQITENKCRLCHENTSEFTSMKNYLFLVLDLSIRIIDEQYIWNKEDTFHQTEIYLEENYTEHIKEEPEDSTDTTVNDVNYNYENNDQEGLNATQSNLSLSFECSLCGLKVSRKSSLVLHLKSHLRSKKRQINRYLVEKEINCKRCPFCRRVYRRKHDCKLCGPKLSNKFLCQFCPEIFTTFEKILRHHRALHPDKPRPLSPFQCEICGSFATRISDLQRHMKTHIEVLPFICNICDKRYLTERKLKEHQRRHIPKAERDDKFKCNICEKRFISRSSLTNHKRFQHTIERKSYDCTFCGLKFISESSLRKHQASHDGEALRPHKCQECGRIFEKLKYFNQHRKIRHNILTDLMLNPKSKKKKT